MLFCDLVGSTSLGEGLDPEALRRVLTRYYEAMRAVVERHGGLVEKFIGDAVMAVFGLPVVHADDALRAIRAAVEMRERLAGLSAELESAYGVAISARTGINTGEVCCRRPCRRARPRDRRRRQRRSSARAGGGSARDPDRRHDPAAGRERRRSRGASRRSRSRARARRSQRGGCSACARASLRWRAGSTRRWSGARASSRSFAMRSPAPCANGRRTSSRARRPGHRQDSSRPRALPVGRRQGPSCSPGAVSPTARGSPTIRSAKPSATRPDPSRRELFSLFWPASRSPSALRGRSRLFSARKTATYSPRRLPGPRGACSRRSRERRPLLVVLEDVHWAEPTFLDLVEYVADLVDDAPMLLLCSARPDLLEIRPGWAGGKANATTIRLEALPPEDAEALLDALAVEAGIPERARSAVAARPRATRSSSSSSLRCWPRSRPRPTSCRCRRRSTLSSPSGSSASGSEERPVLERAAVLGREFRSEALAVFFPDGAVVSVAPVLERLVRRQFLRTQRFGGGRVFRFRHALIQSAAHRSLPKQLRADLHERVAAALDEAGEGEVDELVGYHLEQSFHARSSLGLAVARLCLSAAVPASGLRLPADARTRAATCRPLPTCLGARQGAPPCRRSGSAGPAPDLA